MKVLSLREPYATLIKEKIKTIETRSWKTSYRGELYIHASKTKMIKEDINNQKLMDLVGDSELNFGYIICKCRLVDCVYMDKEFVHKMRENKNEFTCGIYSEGRYAWILEDIEVIDKIPAKGRLNIWNYLD